MTDNISKMAAEAFMEERKLVYTLTEALEAMVKATNGIVSKPKLKPIVEARQKAFKALRLAREQGFLG